MKKPLLWLCLLLLPFAGLAQTPASFQLESVIGTPLFSPSDVAVDAQGYIYTLEDEPFYWLRRGFVTKLNAQGRYVGRIDVRKPNYARPISCQGAAMAMDAAGNIYVVDTGVGEVRKFSPTGQLLLTVKHPGWSPCFLFNPTNLTLDAAGNIYVVGPQFVQKYNAQGVMQWNYATATSPTPAPTSRVMDVAVDAAGNVFYLHSGFTIYKLSPAGQLLQSIPVNRAGQYTLGGTYDSSLLVDATGNFYVGISGGSPVHKFDAAGNYLFSLGANIAGGKLNMALDQAGKLYVSTGGNRGFGSLLYKFEPTGTEITHWGSTERDRYLVQARDGESFVYNWTRQQIIKYAASGQELLHFGGSGYGNGQFEPNNFIGSGAFAGLTVDDQDNVYTIENNGSGRGSRVQKFDSQGHFLSVIGNNTLFAAGAALAGIAVDPAGNIYVADIGTHRVHKLNPQGQLLLTLRATGRRGGLFYQPQAVATDELGFVYVADSAGTRVRQFSPLGQQLRQTAVPERAGVYFNPINPVALSVDRTGTMFLSHAEWDSVRVYSRLGQAQPALPNRFGKVTSLSVNREGTRLLTLGYDSELICAYTGGTFTPRQQSQLRGRLYADANQDCQAQASETGLSGLVVVANPGQYYGLSDQNGNYTIAADTGTYAVTQLLPPGPGRGIQLRCSPVATVHATRYGSAFNGPDFGNEVSVSPFLRVEIASNRRRRCARNATTVSYWNDGYASAANAVVTVALPPEVVFLSASAPHTRNSAGHYVFQVGTLAPNAAGTLIIRDSVVCGNPNLRGLTVCTKAWITPVNTYPSPPGWNRASVAVTGQISANNQVRFVLRNQGTGNMQADSLGLRIYQNSALALQHRYALAPGDSLVLRVPATSAVVRVEADQPLGHPTQQVASATVEVRALSTAGQANAAMTSMPPNAPAPEVAESCLPIVDSFDPNDKLVLPTGTTAQHYTPTNTPLTYRVRFQNTGTDDAYRIVVVDTLSAALDVRTLHVTAASHPYRLVLTGSGRPVLTFTLAGITLPPRALDEPGSNGFVEFTVRPAAGLVPQTRIDNFADIYFDYNPPVRTNTTVNRIYDVPLVVNAGAALTYAAVVASPAVLAFAPAQGRAGTLVTLTGQRFAATTGANRVLFNGVLAPVLNASPTVLTVRVPSAASTGSLVVSTADGGTRTAQSFTVYQPPTLTAPPPGEGTPGAVMTLTGTYFSPVAAQDTVFFNGVQALVQQASATSLQVVVPATATTGRIMVKTLGGTTSSAQDFVVWYPPTASGLTPAKARAGATVRLTGTNFAAGRTQVFFGSAAGTVEQADASSLQVRVPVGAGSGPVRVVTPGGAAATPDFTFVPAPVITGFSPLSGSVGERITVTGLQFLADARPDTITVGGVRALVLSSSTTTTVVQVPRGARSGLLGVAGSGGRNNSTNSFEVLELSLGDAITVHPNPSRGTFALNWLRADFDVQQVRVFNSLGSLVQVTDVSTVPLPELTVDLATRGKGLYLLVLQTARGQLTKRLIVY